VKFNPGDLVTLSDLSGGKISLRPTLHFFDFEEDGPSVRKADIAIVIRSDRADCRNVQIVTRSGLGWVAGAFLKRVE